MLKKCLISAIQPFFGRNLRCDTWKIAICIGKWLRNFGSSLPYYQQLSSPHQFVQWKLSKKPLCVKLGRRFLQRTSSGMRKKLGINLEAQYNITDDTRTKPFVKLLSLGMLQLLSITNAFNPLLRSAAGSTTSFVVTLCPVFLTAISVALAVLEVSI